MVQRIIDLRKPNTDSDQASGKNKKYIIPFPDQTQDHPLNITAQNQVKTNALNEIEWTCYEHDLRERGPYWFLFPLAIEALGILYGIFTKNYIFILFLVIAFILLMLQMKRVPRLITYMINKQGVFIGRHAYGFQQFSSFWIFEYLTVPELLIETRQHMVKFIHLRLENVDIDEVRKIILTYLPEKEQKELAMDQIARIIGF